MPSQEQYNQAGDWQEKGQATDGVLLQVLQYEQTEAVTVGEEELELKEDVDYGSGQVVDVQSDQTLQQAGQAQQQATTTQQEQEWDNLPVGPNQPIRTTKVKKAVSWKKMGCSKIILLRLSKRCIF